MLPEIDVGPLTLQSFGLIFALAFVGCGLMAGRRLIELGKPVDWAYEAVFAALVGGLVGARLHWIAEHWSEVEGDLLGGIFSGSGLVFFGGLAGGAAGVLLWAWRRDFLGLELLDLGAPAIALGYAIGRIGCQISGDGDYGTASDLPWAMAYPDGTVPTTEEVHPTPIYETLAMGVVAWGLWRLRGRLAPGLLLALYMVAAGAERALVELIRRNEAVVAGMTQPQLTALAMLVAGVTWLALAARRGPLRLRAAP